MAQKSCGVVPEKAMRRRDPFLLSLQRVPDRQEFFIHRD